MRSITTQEIIKNIKENVLDKTLKGFQEDGLDFKGILFVGLMITEDGPKVLEYNVRFGDPETQSVLFRLETDLNKIISAVIDNKLNPILNASTATLKNKYNIDIKNLDSKVLKRC